MLTLALLWAVQAAVTRPVLTRPVVARPAVVQPPTASVGSPTVLSVLFGDRRRDVPMVRHPDGGRALRADVLAEALGATFSADGGARYHVQLADTRVEVEVGSAFARVARDTIPMSGAVFRADGRVFLPLAFATELLPRIASGVLFDAERDELRRFGSAVGKREPARGDGANSARPAGTVGRSGGVRQRVVVIDAGHGGVDKGMSGPIGASQKINEKDIVLAVAKELQAALERRGITVVMTRTRDSLIALGDRGKIANQAKGDLFMSIHVNAANPRWQQPSGARGFETYYLAEAKTEDERRVEAMENEVIKFETNADATSDDPLGFIIRDMAQNEHLRESSRLADIIQDGLRRVHPGTNRGVKQAGFMVLVKAFMPAVLVEIGFGSNRADSSYMTNPDGRRALAESLAASAESFLTQYERKVGGGH